MAKLSENSNQAVGKAVADAPEEVLSTLHKDGRRRWLYPVLSKGPFWKRRAVVGWFLMVLFVALPLIPINGKPAILLNIARGEFTFFGLTLYATDFAVVMFVVLFCLISLVLATAVLGRVWCGWACPQTIYLEFLYRPIERLVEGKEMVRKRRDEGPLTREKWVRKAIKWTIFTVLSLGLAHTFVAYFVGWNALVQWVGQPPAEHWGFFLMMAITTGLILFDFGRFREQMCTIACPYARLQSVLMDRDSMIVSYDPGRGETRGRRTREQRTQEQAGVRIDLGDCIDCGACVRTCPTGIDIRDGLQMECIGCTQCIDACDYIMISIGKPRGLIRYTSENQLAKKTTKLLRPRVLMYGVILTVLAVILSFQLGTRGELDINIGRVTGEPYSQLADGNITNRLRFRLQNRTHKNTVVTLNIIKPEGAKLTVVGRPEIGIEKGGTTRTEAWVVIPPDVFVNGQIEGVFEIRTMDGLTETITYTLLGPADYSNSRVSIHRSKSPRALAFHPNRNYRSEVDLNSVEKGLKFSETLELLPGYRSEVDLNSVEKGLKFSETLELLPGYRSKVGLDLVGRSPNTAGISNTYVDPSFARSGRGRPGSVRYRVAPETLSDFFDIPSLDLAERQHKHCSDFAHL